MGDFPQAFMQCNKIGFNKLGYGETEGEEIWERTETMRREREVI
jgi:hypothetical protein